MIFGIGCDLCATARIEKSLTGPHGAQFARRVYSSAEREALNLTAHAAQQRSFSALSAHTVESAAADFAAKEAFLKAAGTGLLGFALADIEVLRKETGAPYYAFGGKAAAWMAENELAAWLSLSHEKGLAQAFCLLERVD